MKAVLLHPLSTLQYNSLRGSLGRRAAVPMMQSLYVCHIPRHTAPLLPHAKHVYIFRSTTYQGDGMGAGRQVDMQGFAKGMHELLVLGVLREGARHGYQIALDVEERSGGRFVFQHGTLYPILHRLEGEGLIVGRWEEAAGRRRKSYRITAAGARRVESELVRVRDVLECVLGLGGERKNEALSDAS
jgi:PadR family transcriptional regulator, regulatory protein PadR